MKNENLEKKIKCALKEFTSKMIEPLDEKYRRCYDCDGLDPVKYCYVLPINNVNHYKGGKIV